MNVNAKDEWESKLKAVEAGPGVGSARSESRLVAGLARHSSEPAAASVTYW